MDKIADKESNGPSISHKEDNATLAAYFKEVLPDYDEERVYPSDIKKVNWYNMLESKGLVVDEEPAIPEEETSVVEDVEAIAEKSKKKKKN
jgi:hypothetical protein